jgi:hypothetical protein
MIKQSCQGWLRSLSLDLSQGEMKVVSFQIPHTVDFSAMVMLSVVFLYSVIYGLVIRTIWMKSKTHETVISNCSGKALNFSALS